MGPGTTRGVACLIYANSSPHFNHLAGMNCYVAMVREHVTSGHAMLALSLSDIEKRLGISNPLHRRKLWLAIEEQRNPEGW